MNKKMNAGYAVVDIGGKQFRIAEGQELKVPSTRGDAGANVQLERVLLLNDGSATHFGSPTVAGASVDATILGHGRERKIIVFKFRRRKGYRKKAGHRQGYSMLRINGINLAESKPPVKAETGKKPAEAAAKTSGKTAATKKTTPAKKTAGKPAAEKKSSTTGKAPAPKKATATKKSPGAVEATESKKATTTKKSAVKDKTAASKKATTASKSSDKKKGTAPKSAVKKKASGS
ncbi:MAG: 50S ribosomal protein L21 [Fidelibacterota bacterium]|nr:MAG: 50S ribosomal protein L21 [Candidatus Neomarinimicrobiota bacterium]